MGTSRQRSAFGLFGVLAVVIVGLVIADAARSVDSVEVFASALFVVVAVGAMFGVGGGLAASFASTVVYALLRRGAVDLAGSDSANRLIAARGFGYLAFGVLGGWLVKTLRSLRDAPADARAAEALRREIGSATRHDRPLSVVAVDAANLAHDQLVGIRSRLRVSDFAGYAADNRLVTIVLPDTDEAGARVVLQRLGPELDALSPQLLTLAANRPALEELAAVGRS